MSLVHPTNNCWGDSRVAVSRFFYVSSHERVYPKYKNKKYKNYNSFILLKCPLTCLRILECTLLVCESVGGLGLRFVTVVGHGGFGGVRG